MSSRPERDLRHSLVFPSDGESLWELRENMPWPTPGETLLDRTVARESFISPFSEWLLGDLAQLDLFAHLYQECARTLVRRWVRAPSPSETIAYVVGFLYRHALELNLKAIVAPRSDFMGLHPDEQRAMLQDHSLHRLWNHSRPHLIGACDAEELETVERQILDVHTLDERSDGFRYPFGFRGQSGQRIPLLQGLASVSFDNFVWILDGVNSWLRSTQDVEAPYGES